MLKHEIFWLIGVALFSFGFCCLDSSDDVLFAPVAIIIIGFAIAAAGFWEMKKSVKP